MMSSGGDEEEEESDEEAEARAEVILYVCSLHSRS